jgi:hypothetical protein
LMLVSDELAVGSDAAQWCLAGGWDFNGHESFQ